MTHIELFRGAGINNKWLLILPNLLRFLSIYSLYIAIPEGIDSFSEYDYSGGYHEYGKSGSYQNKFSFQHIRKLGNEQIRT